jgi:hypothetical protein
VIFVAGWPGPGEAGGIDESKPALPEGAVKLERRFWVVAVPFCPVRFLAAGRSRG